jgi:hypothetical protein
MFADRTLASLGLGFAANMIGEQHWRQRSAHVEFDVKGEHAQEHVRFDALGQPVMYGANLKVDGAVGLKAIDG